MSSQRSSAGGCPSGARGRAFESRRAHVFDLHPAASYPVDPQPQGPLVRPSAYAHRPPHRPYGGLPVESEGRGEVPVGVDLRVQIGDLLLRGGNGIGAGEKAARRRLLARNDDERSRELRSALVEVLDGRLGVVRRLLGEELSRPSPGRMAADIWQFAVVQRGGRVGRAAGCPDCLASNAQGSGPWASLFPSRSDALPTPASQDQSRIDTSRRP
jgi:hypothetical protein